MQPPRLKWQRHGEGRDLIAYLEADKRSGRIAEIRYDATSSTPWRWQINYDLAKASGSVKNRQAASDQANERLPQVIERAEELAVEAAKADALRTLVQRQCEVGDLPLSAFEIETSDSARLTSIIWLVQVRGPGALTGPAKPLVAACSAELFRRRTGG